tara:strand:- start:3017 stop:3382 length:366 start_codon:yes stop_codon:yes gene_type:complete
VEQFFHKHLVKFTMIVTLPLWLAFLFSTRTEASGYASYKHELPLADYKLQADINHLRIGYRFDNRMYIEAGAMTGGTGIEMGYKFKKGNWIVKGKFEGTDTTQRDYFKSKVETEIIYTFGG